MCGAICAEGCGLRTNADQTDGHNPYCLSCSNRIELGVYVRFAARSIAASFTAGWPLADQSDLRPPDASAGRCS
jgi:hypothetical protein